MRARYIINILLLNKSELTMWYLICKIKKLSYKYSITSNKHVPTAMESDGGLIHAFIIHTINDNVKIAFHYKNVGIK